MTLLRSFKRQLIVLLALAVAANAWALSDFRGCAIGDCAAAAPVSSHIDPAALAFLGAAEDVLQDYSDGSDEGPFVRVAGFDRPRSGTAVAAKAVVVSLHPHDAYPQKTGPPLC